MIHLPPLAYLSQVLDCLEELTSLLRRALAPAEHFTRTRNDAENDLRLVIALHAVNALHAARAIRALASTKMGNSIFPHVRIIFEALVKMRWLAKDATRATRYLQSEPFNRYLLATERVRLTEHFRIALRDCSHAIEADPSLLDLPKRRPNYIGPVSYREIGRALPMPRMKKMASEIGMDDEDYFIDYAVPSQQPHSSPTHTKAFAPKINSDNTALITTDESNALLLSYSARSLPHVGNVLVEVLHSFPDGAVEYAAEQLAERIADLVTKLRGQV